MNWSSHTPTTSAHIVLPESHDRRVVEAAIQVATSSPIRMTLLCRSAAQLLAQYPALSTTTGIELLEYRCSTHLPQYAEILYQKRQHKGLTVDAAQKLLQEPMYYAVAMLLAGHADGVVSGSMSSTADTMRPALQLLGQGTLVSSFFIMECRHGAYAGQTLYFADCALVVDPNAAELAQIAIDTADSYRTLMQSEPRVAMISYSTHGSGTGPSVTKVAEATKLAHASRPDILLDGELQIDAALVPAVAAAKAPSSPIAGQANVLVFPNLDAGNTAYKLVERLGSARAIGPITQGLTHPVNDLSRGANVADIAEVIRVTAAQVGAK